MPCGDTGYQGCSRLHVGDATEKQLRKALSKAIRWRKEAPLRKKLTEVYVKGLLKAVGKIHGGNEEVDIEHGEKNKTELFTVKLSDIERHFRDWLSDCKPFPKKMKFTFKRSGGETKLVTWHIH